MQHPHKPKAQQKRAHGARGIQRHVGPRPCLHLAGGRWREAATAQLQVQRLGHEVQLPPRQCPEPKPLAGPGTEEELLAGAQLRLRSRGRLH